MDALTSSTLLGKLAEPFSSWNSCASSFIKFPSFEDGFKTHTNSDVLRLSGRRSCIRALANEVSGDGEGGEGSRGNASAFPGFEVLLAFCSKINFLNILRQDMEPLFEMKIDGSQSHATQACRRYDSSSSGTEEAKLITSFTTSNGPIGTGTRTGLFRTPISGGVHSATSAHDLPLPALAVRNLMEQARFAHVCTLMSRMHHHRAGYPFGSLVDFAADSIGHPIFSLSPLAIHTRNLLADPRCSLVVQIPGWSGLSNARLTIFGDTFPLPANEQEWACRQFISKHQQWASHEWGNFYYYRMDSISDIYFIGGFGTVQWIDVKDYENTQPDKIAADGGEQNLKELNAIFSKPVREMLSIEGEIDDAAFISIDSKGTDIRVRQGAQINIQRLSFDVEHGVETLEEAKKALQKIIDRGCTSRTYFRN